MSNKAIILNSGGFDSVLMINDLVNLSPDTKFISLFFNYGQRNVLLERDCARKVANKYHLEHIEIDLPKFQWTDCSLYNDESITEYLEMRNVIFIAYALSLAENRGAKEIYSAILSGGTYTDTSATFIANTEKYLRTFNIDFKTPFSDHTKYDLGYLARMYDLKPEDYFSCNHPKDNKPCGECADCKAIQVVQENYLDNNTPIKEWLDNGVTDKFKELFNVAPLDEARLLINNKCQFSCKHCFYGFDETVSPDLSFDEMCGIIDQVAKIESINNIHFSGKEPLYNDLIFDYVKYIKDNYPHLTYDVVTNGLSLPKYVKKIAKYGFRKVYLSVDDLFDDQMTIRPTGNFIVKNIDLLHKHNVPVEIFVDVHKGNVNRIEGIINYLHHEKNINDFYIRTVAPLGKGINFADKILTLEDVETVYKTLINIESGKDLHMTFHIQSGFTREALIKKSGRMYEDIEILTTTTDPYITPYLCFIPEFYCSSGEKQITITSDGYLLGCATEVSSKVYNKISGGNLREVSLADAIQNKRNMTLNILERQKGDNVQPCYHTYYKIKENNYQNSCQL